MTKKEKEQRIKELKIKRANLIEDFNGDRCNKECIKQEKEILKEIEKLME